MKVLLVSEGTHELGGALDALVARLLEGVQTETTCMKIKDVRRLHRGKGGGLFRKCLSALVEAERSGFDAIVVVVDQDGFPEREREMDQAQGWTTSNIKRAFGVAIKTFDAWMLADENALSSIFRTDISRQRSPEKIADPKSAFRNLMAACPTENSQSKLYAMISELTDLDVIVERCPKGFKPFAENVRRMA